jgi:hypothetical protein
MFTQKRFLKSAFCIFSVLDVMAGVWVGLLEMEPLVLLAYKTIGFWKQECD